MTIDLPSTLMLLAVFGLLLFAFSEPWSVEAARRDLKSRVLMFWHWAARCAWRGMSWLVDTVKGKRR